jgi:hypothetical protein
MFADPHTYSGDRNGDRHPTRQPYPDGAASRDRGAKRVGCPTIPKPDTTAETDPAGPPIHPAEGGLVTTARHRVGPMGAFVNHAAHRNRGVRSVVLDPTTRHRADPPGTNRSVRPPPCPLEQDQAGAGAARPPATIRNRHRRGSAVVRRERLLRPWPTKILPPRIRESEGSPGLPTPMFQSADPDPTASITGCDCPHADEVRPDGEAPLGLAPAMVSVATK